MSSRAPLLFAVLLNIACDAEPSHDAARIDRSQAARAAQADATSSDDTSTSLDDTSTSTSLDDTSTGLDDTSLDDTSTTPELGTFDSPHLVTRWPYVVDHTTTGALSDHIDRYGCAPATDEGGPEVVYTLTLDAPGLFVAELAEADGVDVDLHLLATPPDPSATEAGCLARANTRLALDLAAGSYWLVVDTYTNTSGPQSGAYRLALEHTVLDRWQDVAVAPGVVWRQKVYADYAGGRQTINTLEVDVSHPEVEVVPYLGGACSRPSAVGLAQGAIAVINGGFFDTGPGTCPPLDLVKIDGVAESLNHLTGAAQRSFGITADGDPLMAWIDANRDWPEAHHALGGYPSLVTDGVVLIEPARDTSFFDARHPRTALGLRPDGTLLLVTVDGRTAAGVGMTMAALAQHMVNLGADDAMNLDGGGSTAMWIRDQSINGIVNFPSDDGDTDHEGERGVADLLMVLPR